MRRTTDDEDKKLAKHDDDIGAFVVSMTNSPVQKMDDVLLIRAVEMERHFCICAMMMMTRKRSREERHALRRGV